MPASQGYYEHTEEVSLEQRLPVRGLSYHPPSLRRQLSHHHHSDSSARLYHLVLP